MQISNIIKYVPFLASTVCLIMFISFLIYLIFKKREKKKIFMLTIIFFAGILFTLVQGLMNINEKKESIVILHKMKISLLIIGFIMFTEYLNLICNLCLEKIRLFFHSIFGILLLAVIFTPFILKNEITKININSFNFAYNVSVKGPLYSLMVFSIFLFSGIYLIRMIQLKKYKNCRDNMNLMTISVFILTALNDFGVSYKMIDNLFMAGIGFLGFSLIQSILLTLSILKNEESLYSKNYELKKTKIELNKLNELSKDISISLDFDKAFIKIFNYLNKEFGFEGCTLNMICEDKKHFIIEKYVLPDKIKQVLNTEKKIRFPLSMEFGWAPQSMINNKIMYIAEINPEKIENIFIRRAVEFQNLKSILNIPINLNSETIGSLSLGSYSKNIILCSEDIASISRFVDHIAINVRNSKIFDLLENLSTIDSLTGSYNRRKILEDLNYELERSARYHHVFSVILFDLDFFKNINDTYGHLFGDFVLKETVSIIKNKILRKTDKLGRYGGEEFLIILPETTTKNAVEVAKRINSIISKNNFIKNETEVNITVSCGVSSSRLCKTIDDILKRADTALYDAKNQGRNRTNIFRQVLKEQNTQKKVN